LIPSFSRYQSSPDTRVLFVSRFSRYQGSLSTRDLWKPWFSRNQGSPGTKFMYCSKLNPENINILKPGVRKSVFWYKRHLLTNPDIFSILSISKSLYLYLSISLYFFLPFCIYLSISNFFPHFLLLPSNIKYSYSSCF